jgi:hypothetical protein
VHRPGTERCGAAEKAHVCFTIIGIAVLAAISSGCFVYRPYSTELAKPNEELRLIVTDGASLRLKQQFGLNTPLDGRLTPLNADTIGVLVWVGRDFSGSDFATIRQTVPVLRTDIVEVYRKRFSAQRTAYFTAGIIAVTAILVDRLGLVDLPWRDDTETPTPPEPDPFRRRTFR